MLSHILTYSLIISHNEFLVVWHAPVLSKDSLLIYMSFLGNSQVGGFLHIATHDAGTGWYWSCILGVDVNPHPASEHFQLHYLRLPKDISEDHVILMDCTVSTGAAAMMAVRVLLVGAPNCSQVSGLLPSCSLFSWPCFHFQDHDVQEDKILLVSLLMAEMGVHSVAYAFPQVKIITTAVDKKVNDLFHIIPGIGK